MDWNIPMDKTRHRPKASHYVATPDLGIQLLDYPRCAAMLDVSSQALRSMVRRGQVPADAIVRIGTRVRFKAAAIAAWIEALSAGQGGGDKGAA